jgi:hypothetical protein
MSIRTRTLAVASGWVVAGAIVVGIAGVAVAGSGSDSAADSAATTAELSVVTGGLTGGLTGGGGDAADVEAKARHPRARAWLWRHLEHGELVVRTPDEHRQTLVQRGEILKVSEVSMTVRSADGFVATWALGEDTRVRRQGDPARVGDLRSGDQVAVAGPGTGDSGQARWVRAREALD